MKMKDKLKRLHRTLIRIGDFKSAKIVFGLLRKGEYDLGIFYDDLDLLRLRIYFDAIQDYEIKFTTDNKIIWRTYGLYKKSQADTLSD